MGLFESETFGSSTYQNIHSWYFRVSAGYVWLRDYKYYLFANKTVESIAEGATTHTIAVPPVLPGPLIVTSGPAATDPSALDTNPFALVSNNDSTKWRRKITISSSMEYSYDPDTAIITLSAAPANTTVAFEGSTTTLWYGVTKFDMNPYNSVDHNGILYVDTDEMMPDRIVV